MKQRRRPEQVRREALTSLSEELFRTPIVPNRTVADLVDEELRRDSSRDRAELSLEIRALIADLLGCPLYRVRESGLLRDLLEGWKGPA